jgi:hypothetical protein
LELSEIEFGRSCECNRMVIRLHVMSRHVTWHDITSLESLRLKYNSEAFNYIHLKEHLSSGDFLSWIRFSILSKSFPFDRQANERIGNHEEISSSYDNRSEQRTDRCLEQNTGKPLPSVTTFDSLMNFHVFTPK